MYNGIATLLDRPDVLPQRLRLAGLLECPKVYASELVENPEQKATEFVVALFWNQFSNQRAKSLLMGDAVKDRLQQCRFQADLCRRNTKYQCRCWVPWQQRASFVQSPEARLRDVWMVHVVGLQPLSGELVEDLTVKIVMPSENVSSEMPIQLADELVTCNVLFVIHRRTGAIILPAIA